MPVRPWRERAGVKRSGTTDAASVFCFGRGRAFFVAPAGPGSIKLYVLCKGAVSHEREKIHPPYPNVNNLSLWRDI